MFPQRRIDYGVMSSCLVKPALYVVQRTGPRVRLVDQSMASPDPGQEMEGDTEQDTGAHTSSLELSTGLWKNLQSAEKAPTGGPPI